MSKLYKNWPEIGKIQDWNLMFAVARVDPSSEIGQKFYRGFPEFFTDKETGGPVPWSLLVEEGKREANRQGIDANKEDLWGLCILEEFDIPFIVISVTEDNFKRYGKRNEWEFVPELDGKCFGEKVTWNQHGYVAVSPTEWVGEVVLVPIECIDMTK